MCFPVFPLLNIATNWASCNCDDSWKKFLPGQWIYLIFSVQSTMYNILLNCMTRLNSNESTYLAPTGSSQMTQTNGCISPTFQSHRKCYGTPLNFRKCVGLEAIEWKTVEKTQDLRWPSSTTGPWTVVLPAWGPPVQNYLPETALNVFIPLKF